MSCIHAVTLSCGLPFIFERAIYNGDYYVDGGFFNNFPMRWVCDGAEAPERVLGIVAIDTPTDHIDNLYTYIERILAFQFYFVTEQNIQDAPSNATVITIECPGQAIFSTSMPSEVKGQLFSAGVDAARRKMDASAKKG
jgi:predicted acylesterase/phospholipase RssA